MFQGVTFCMVKKNIVAIACCLAMTAALSGCGQKNISVSDSKKAATTSAASEASNIAFGSDVRNFTAPEKGEKIIILKVKDYGEIKIKLFPEYAELGVENFLGLAEQNYYDGIIFHRIINNFMIQGGDPTGTGRGGQSIYGEKFDGGVDPHLIHVSGALAYANSGSTSTNGSQFYIVTGNTYTESQFPENYPESAKQAYLKAGGYPYLDGGYTVFGQVFDGLDIVFKLQQVQTDSNDKPLKDVVIESLTVGEYNGEELKWYITDYPEYSGQTTEAASEETTSATEADSEASETAAEQEDTSASSEETSEETSAE